MRSSTAVTRRLLGLGKVLSMGLVGLTSSSLLLACQPEPTPTESPTPQASSSSEPKKVLTTFTVLADMAQRIGGDKVIVESLTKPGAEVHGYEPTPSDLVRAQDADLILDNGLGLERWAEKFYGSVQDVRRITVSHGVEVIPIATGPNANQPNPHAWMSPAAALVYVNNIRQALVDLDPNNATTYNTNAAAYSQDIKELGKKLESAFQQIPEDQRTLVTCEGAFSYLARDYGFNEVYLWPINSDQNGTPQQIRQVVDTVQAQGIPVVFCESTVNNQAQQQVARETNAKFGGVFYVDSLTDATGPAPTYLDLLSTNIETLKTGFQLPTEPTGAQP